MSRFEAVKRGARAGLWLAAAALGGLLGACHARQRGPELPVVPHVDLGRYVGTWYEIARYPHPFQEGCFASTATYTLREDGKIDVLNACRQGGPEGPLRTARATARVVDASTNAKLAVTFFWPFSGAYWIIDLAEDYRYAVVGHPSREYLWILSRIPTLDDDTYRGILERLRRLGYETERLVPATPSP